MCVSATLNMLFKCCQRLFFGLAIFLLCTLWDRTGRSKERLPHHCFRGSTENAPSTVDFCHAWIFVLFVDSLAWLVAWRVAPPCDWGLSSTLQSTSGARYIRPCSDKKTRPPHSFEWGQFGHIVQRCPRIGLQQKNAGLSLIAVKEIKKTHPYQCNPLYCFEGRTVFGLTARYHRFPLPQLAINGHRQRSPLINHACMSICLPVPPILMKRLPK